MNYRNINTSFFKNFSFLHYTCNSTTTLRSQPSIYFEFFSWFFFFNSMIVFISSGLLFKVCKSVTVSAMNLSIANDFAAISDFTRKYVLNLNNPYNMIYALTPEVATFNIQNVHCACLRNTIFSWRGGHMIRNVDNAAGFDSIIHSYWFIVDYYMNRGNRASTRFTEALTSLTA
ncbi:hypothetical protein AGLY_003115 [Aphis glycines]|uniref:Uncharacterized protein n=1 Tax=Aphis glycines TaxID=307491 RepID=A0A6G0U2A2_APHGL|nr:hypothetical protein AGLY_003115 [Aphis glycines]